ncbi:MAG: ASKHA domain-containing protein [Anaerolineae bacterium]|nr:ASKHA domain-containing protein [Anaerolineae bacterium]MDW8071063.1 ASKHA domain-containing protein [Anaerolineae bacterium]
MRTSDPSGSTVHVEFEPIGRRGTVASAMSLLDAARHLGVELVSVCGGVGICGRCKVRVLSGQLSALTAHERDALTQREVEQNFRLACMAYPLSDCKVDVPAESLSTPMRTQVEGMEGAVELIEPPVRSVTVELEPPSLGHPTADAENLLRAVGRLSDEAVTEIDLGVLQELPRQLRAWEWRCQAHIRGDTIVAVTPVGAPPLGLAVDLGSTKIAGYLVDLRDGHLLASHGMMNPQISYGEDIVSRITYAESNSEGAVRLQQAVVEGLNQLIDALCDTAGADRQHIVEAVIVGNTAMHHLLLRLPTRQLARSPFIPAVVSALDIQARDVGLRIAPGAHVYIPPNIAGYVGADHVAVLIATAHTWSEGTTLVLDIGTNTEISLITPVGAITSLSCASGPAFEGYHIQHGIRATAGAIERVQITPERVFYKTIHDAPPVGICGSGILDAIAQLRLAGVLGENGAFRAGSHPRLRRSNGQWHFVLAEQDGRVITVTQQDVREIQLAKAAIQTGIEVLLRENGLAAEQVSKVLIAGAFGSYLDIANAVAIGLLPDLPLERFAQIGNAAGVGARQLLLSSSLRQKARTLHTQVHFIELATYPGFGKMFARNCRLAPHPRCETGTFDAHS